MQFSIHILKEYSYLVISTEAQSTASTLPQKLKKKEAQTQTYTHITVPATNIV